MLEITHKNKEIFMSGLIIGVILSVLITTFPASILGRIENMPNNNISQVSNAFQFNVEPVSSISSVVDLESEPTKRVPVSNYIGMIVHIICPISDGVITGSGIIISGDSSGNARVLTSKHILKNMTGVCKVYQSESYDEQPSLFFKTSNNFVFSQKYDLAILSYSDDFSMNSSNLNFEFAKKSEGLFEDVFVFGFPPSAGSNITFTKGVISGAEKIAGDTMLKTDAKIDNGSSGGPVFNKAGNLIGITTYASQGTYSSYGYIIPSEIVKEFINDVALQDSNKIGTVIIR